MCSIVILNSHQSKELPRWFMERIPSAEDRETLQKKLMDIEAEPLCTVVNCPNLADCFSNGTAAFQILGSTCSRKCSFCSVPEGLPRKVDQSEVEKITKSARTLALRKVVLSSAPRDDLIFGGAGFFSRAIGYLQNELDVVIEAHVPDFQGSKEALGKVVKAQPDVVSHSLETVPRLYYSICPKNDYNRSLELLAEIKEIDSDIITKSGFMLGLGETDDEIIKVMEDLRQVDCDLLTIGQYISPSKDHFPVHGFVLPNQFKDWEAVGKGMGFKGIASAPLVRSSYHVEFRNSYRLKESG